MITAVIRGLIAGIIISCALAGTLWAEETPILVRQGEFQATIYPIVGELPVEGFYNYSNLDYQSRIPLGLEVPRHSLLFFYRDLQTGRLSLVIVHNAPNSGPSGRVRFEISGLPPAARLTVKDDPDDSYSFEPPEAGFEWRWASGHTDGVVIEGLGEQLTLTITPQFIEGITHWKLLTLKDPEVGIERVPLPSLTEPLHIAIGMVEPLQAAFRYSPEVVRVGVPVAFDARTSRGVGIVRYEWDFDGDGIFDVSTEDSITTHTFRESGTFTVTLRITDSAGLTAETSQTITVREERALVWREISTSQARPGDIFRVVVEIEVQVASNGLGLEEELPLGWTIEPVENDGAIFKFTGSAGQWLFPTLLKVGERRRIVYEVRLPSAEEMRVSPLPARFSIRGEVSSVSPAYMIPVAGESEVEVVSCLGIPVAVAHLDLQSGRVDLKLSERISPEQLTQALKFWITDAPVPGTCGSQITSDQLMRVLMHRLLEISVDEPLPPPALDPTAPPLSATRTIITPLPADKVYLGSEEGRHFRVELRVEAHRDLPGALIAERLPEGWKINSLAPADMLFKARTGEWVIPHLLPAGSVSLLAYETVVPQDAEPGPTELTGSSESGLMAFLNPTGGESTVEVVECLSVLMAIAHLDVERGRVDVKLDNYITRRQAEAAFLLWFEDQEVPGTCGGRLDLATLQRVISHMVTGMPVEE